jgi:hypothetical protein
MLSCVRLVPIRTRTLVKVTNTSLTHSVLLTPTSSRAFSVLNRPPPSYDGHVPLTRIEKGALAVGSALGAIVNPRRAGTFLQASPYTIADCTHSSRPINSRQQKSCQQGSKIDDTPGGRGNVGTIPERYSIAYFSAPDPATVVEALSCCCRDRAPKKSINAGEYLRRKRAAMYA